jgi:hypothetical protein
VISAPAISSHHDAAPFSVVLEQLSSAFARVPSSEIGTQMEQWLEKIARCLGLDRSVVAGFQPEKTDFQVLYQWTRKGFQALGNSRSAFVAPLFHESPNSWPPVTRKVWPNTFENLSVARRIAPRGPKPRPQTLLRRGRNRHRLPRARIANLPHDAIAAGRSLKRLRDLHASG